MSLNFRKQQGFLSVVAVLLILVVGFIGTATAYMYFSSSFSTGYYSQAASAFYLAEAGLEEGTRLLLTPNLSGTATRLACGSLSGNSNLTNISLGSGTYTVSTTGTAPNFAFSTLSSAVTSSSSSIPVASAANFAASGRVLIDKEIINYAAISGSSLIGLTRGSDLSTASSHSTGAYVSQFQCSLDSKGGTPNLTSPATQRELQQGVELQQAWAVGNSSANNFVLTQWNHPNELQWASGSFTDAGNRANLASVSLLSNAEGWAVGDVKGSNLTIVHLTGSSWVATPLSGACSGQNLTGVSSVSSQEAWAVGVSYRVNSCTSGNFRYSILRWNGSSWTKLSPSTSPSTPADTTTTQTLNSISMLDSNGDGTANLGFAVGNGGLILQYNGASWSSISSPTTQNLNGVSLVSTTEAWAVGNNGTILKWNGSSWSSFSSPTATTLNALDMIDSNGNGSANSGVAVGNNGVTAIYNGSSWSLQDLGSTTLNGVAVYNANDAWAVGAGGAVFHWNGSAWTSFTSNVSAALNAIDAIRPKDYPFSAWKEVFP